MTKTIYFHSLISLLWLFSRIINQIRFNYVAWVDSLLEFVPQTDAEEPIDDVKRKETSSISSNSFRRRGIDM